MNRLPLIFNILCVYLSWIAVISCYYFLFFFDPFSLILINSLWLFEFVYVMNDSLTCTPNTVRATHFYMLYTPHRYIYWVCGFCGLNEMMISRKMCNIKLALCMWRIHLKCLYHNISIQHPTLIFHDNFLN